MGQPQPAAKYSPAARPRPLEQDGGEKQKSKSEKKPKPSVGQAKGSLMSEGTRERRKAMQKGSLAVSHQQIDAQPVLKPWYLGTTSSPPRRVFLLSIMLPGMECPSGPRGRLSRLCPRPLSPPAPSLQPQFSSACRKRLEAAAGAEPGVWFLALRQ